MQRLVHSRLAVMIAFGVLVGFITVTSAKADDILLFDDSNPNGTITVTFNGTVVPLLGTVTSPSQSSATTLSSAPENVGVQLFVLGIPNFPTITNYFNIYEPDGTLGDVITMTFSGDPVINITFQSALAGGSLTAGVSVPGVSTATKLTETGQLQTATIMTTTNPKHRPGGFQLHF